MKYIDAEKLIAEIDALKRREGFLPLDNFEITEAYMARGIQFACDDIVNLIDSLQQEQPEVDLDALVNEAFDKYSSVDGYGQLAVSFNRAELYSFIKKIARKEEQK